MKAISIIKAEHRSLGAVLFTLGALVKDIENSEKQIPFRVFHGLVLYLDGFLDRYHHPKETRHLFPAILERCPDARDIVEKLGKEHAEGERLLIELLRTLSAYEFLGEPGFAPFRDAVNRYVEFERDHAQTEERELLPLACTHLTEDDWRSIDAAFEDNDDPLFGEKPSAEFRDLLQTLSLRVPAPYGLGPA